MIEVEQRQLWRPVDHSDGPQRGDCLRTCVASIFEVAYEETADIDGYGNHLRAWVRERYDGVDVSERSFQQFGEKQTLDSYKDWPTSHYETGYWIASIWSPRIPDTESFDCGCAYNEDGSPKPADSDCKWCHGEPHKRSMGITWGLHAVVMCNGQLVWDPHPERTGHIDHFEGATTFRVVDPAKLSQRCRRGACGERIVDECYHRENPKAKD